MLRRLPLALTLLRALLAPLLILLAIDCPSRSAFGLCLLAGFLSDVFDGIVARRLKVATAGLRRLDSLADTIFYLAAVYAIWRLHPAALLSHRAALLMLAALELSRYVFDGIKFGREASYHLWSSKLWGIALFAGCFAVLVLDASGLPVALAIYTGIVADLEGLAVSAVLRHWRTDVPSLLHAVRLRAVASR